MLDARNSCYFQTLVKLETLSICHPLGVGVDSKPYLGFFMLFLQLVRTAISFNISDSELGITSIGGSPCYCGHCTTSPPEISTPSHSNYFFPATYHLSSHCTVSVLKQDADRFDVLSCFVSRPATGEQSEVYWSSSFFRLTYVTSTLKCSNSLDWMILFLSHCHCTYLWSRFLKLAVTFNLLPDTWQKATKPIFSLWV